MGRTVRTGDDRGDGLRHASHRLPQRRRTRDCRHRQHRVPLLRSCRTGGRDPPRRPVEPCRLPRRRPLRGDGYPVTFVDGEECAAGAWASGTGPPVSGDDGDVTLLEGSTFCISALSGDVHRDRPHGLFVADTRMLSFWRLAIEGAAVQNLSTIEEPSEPYRAPFVGRTPPRQWMADSTMLVLRDRLVGDGMREDVTLRNLGPEPIGVTLTLAVDTDLADLFRSE